MLFIVHRLISCTTLAPSEISTHWLVFCSIAILALMSGGGSRLHSCCRRAIACLR
jgi:hypothetical protein